MVWQKHSSEILGCSIGEKKMAKKLPFQIEKKDGFVFLTRNGEPFDFPFVDEPDNVEFLKSERARLNTSHVLDGTF